MHALSSTAQLAEKKLLSPWPKLVDTHKDVCQIVRTVVQSYRRGGSDVTLTL